jgi:hypothetical protein
MAVNLVSPGVNIREVDLTIGRADQTNEQVGVLAGPFEKGPINVPTRITSEQELISVFGKPKVEDDQNEYWWSASNYLSYGGSLRVIRVGNQDSQVGRLNNANVGTDQESIELRIFNSENYDNDHRNATDWYYAAKTPGSWANDLRICTIDNFADQIISGIDTTGIQVGFAVTQTVESRTAVDGTNIREFLGHIRGLITGIGNSEIYVKVIDLYELNQDLVSGETLGSGPEFIPIEYKKPGSSTTMPYAFIESGDDIDFNIVNSAGIAITTIPNDGTVSVSDWYDQQTLGLPGRKIFWKSVAPKPGTSQYAAERTSKNDEIHIVVVDETGKATGVSGNIVEKFLNLSKASDARISPSRNVYFKELLVGSSNYVYAGSLETGVVSSLTPVNNNIYSFITKNTVWGTPAQNSSYGVLGAKSYVLKSGSDYSGNNFINGYLSTTNEIINGYNLVSNPAEFSISYLINGPSGGPSEFDAQSKANTLIAIAENRKDCIAVISPYKDFIVNQFNSEVQVNELLRFFGPLTSSSYAVFDGNFKYTFDRFNNRFFYLPCNSDVAGLMARTSLNNYPWFSPAGSVRGGLNNVIKLAFNPSKDQRDSLYTNRINPIISNNGSGFILFGDKTALSYSSAFDRINVRKLFLTLERTIEFAARAQLFEFNDAITRTNFINIVEPYLRDVRAKRGITEFLVVCDETNNTPDVIDSNQFKADIYIKPARSINFIGLTFVATRTGVSFSEVVGTV